MKVPVLSHVENYPFIRRIYHKDICTDIFFSQEIETEGSKKSDKKKKKKKHKKSDIESD